MPGLRVGTYDSLKVAPTPSPVVLRDSNVPNPMGILAKGLGDATSIFAEQQLQEKRKLEDAQSLEFQRKAAAVMTQLTTDAKKAPAETLLKPGADGESGLASYTNQWEKFTQEQIDAAPTEAMRQRLRNESMAMGRLFDSHMAGIHADAATAYKASEDKAGVMGSAQNVSTNPLDDNIFALNAALREKSIRSMNQGLAPEAIDAAVAAGQSELLAHRIKSLLLMPNGEGTLKARALVSDKGVQAQLNDDMGRKLIQDAMAKSRPTLAYDLATANYDPTKPEDQKLTTSDLDKRARKLSESDPEMFPLIREQFRQIKQDFDHDLTRSDRMATYSVDEWSLPYVLQHGRYPSKQATILQALKSGATSSQAEHIADTYEGKNKAADAHAKAMREHQTPAQAKDIIDETNAMVETALADPESLAGLSSDQFSIKYKALRDAATPEQWSRVKSIYLSLKKAPSAVKLTSEMSNELAVKMAEMGYIPNAKPQGAAQIGMLKQAQANLVEQLVPLMKPGMKAPDRATLDKAITATLRKVKVPGKVFGSAWPTDTPVFQLPSEKKDDQGNVVYRQLDGSYSPTKPVGYKAPVIEEEN